MVRGAARGLGLSLLLVAGCAFPAQEKVYVIVCNPPPASAEPVAKILSHVEEVKPPPARLPAAIEEEELGMNERGAIPIGQFAPIQRVEHRTAAPVAQPFADVTAQPVGTVKATSVAPAPAKVETVIAVGGARGIDPLLLEPPPAYPRRGTPTTSAEQ